MSRQPSNVIDPSLQQLHAQVVKDLKRPIADAPGAGAIVSLGVAAATFGALPAVFWPLRWGAYVAEERRQCRDLAEWLRLNSRHPAAARLVRRAGAIRPVPLLSIVTFVGAALAAVLVVGLALNHGLHALLSCTYAYGVGSPSTWDPWPFPGRIGSAGLTLADAQVRQLLFIAWTGSIGLAATAHWLQVQLHARRVRAFLDDFNTVAIHDGLAPAFLEPIGLGLRPIWIIAAIILVTNSALWAVPMALAGAVQRRYARRSGPMARAALSARLHDLAAFRRPPPVFVMPHPAYAAPPTPPAPPPRLRCATQGCRLPLPAGARYCPRCGVRAAAPLDRVA